MTKLQTTLEISKCNPSVVTQGTQKADAVITLDPLIIPKPLLGRNRP